MIRKANEKDIAQLNELYFELQDSLQYLRVIKLSKKKMINRFSKNDLKNIFVAQEEGKVVGFARFGKLKNDEWVGKCIELEEIFVTKKFEGGGIGQELMKVIFDVAKKKKANVLLIMHPKNKRALDFYLKEGFETVGQHMCAKPN